MATDWKQTIFKAGLNALYYTGAHQALSPVSRGAGLIFMLHRVLPARDDPFQPNGHLEITPDFLRAVVGRVRGMGLDIVDLDEAARRLVSGGEGRRFAVFTFDDGYRDNHEIARPILVELGVPFTVYVASGLIDRTTELWWLALERMIAARDFLDVAIHGADRTFDCATPDAKTRTFRELADYFTEISEGSQRSEIRALAEAEGFDLAGLCDEVGMTWDDVRALAAAPGVTIGGHTHDHHAVARLTPEAAEADIVRGLDRLEAETGRRPTHFAYPYGSAEAAGPRDYALASKLGFRTAVTTRPGVLFPDHRDHLTALPRVSLNGHYQDLRYLDLFLTGAPFALFNRFRRVNAA